MAMIVVLLEQAEDEFCLRQEAVSELARLGITNLALVRDQHTIGVVLEGWLFDPPRSAAAAANAIGTAQATRTLHPVMHLAVPTATHTKEVQIAHQVS